MQYALRTPEPALHMSAIQRALAALDPAAVLDLDDSGQVVRISTWATAGEVIDCLRSVGAAIDTGCLVQLPSVCCGGCSG